MSTQPLQSAIATTRGVLANVSTDQMGNPTPCTSWDVAALINHIVGAQHFFLAGLRGTPPAEQPDHAAGDYVAAYDEVCADVVAFLGQEGALDATYALPFGEMPGSAVMGLAMTDTFQHGWDLAKATGQSTDLAPDLAEALLVQSRAAIQDAFRGPEGAPFGPEAGCPDGASQADQLAAFLGRTV